MPPDQLNGGWRTNFAHVILVHLGEVMIPEAVEELLQEVVEGDDRLVAQLGEDEGIRIVVHV
jgi:hypothetical protein